MGFFSDLMKNPVVQMALPYALSYFMPGIGSLVGTSAISNPMMRSAAEQAMLGYGTAAISGSKHPEKAAMYAGLGSMPFSFMKANQAANIYNEGMTDYNLADFQTERIMTDPGKAAQEAFYSGPGGMEQQLGIGTYNPAQKYIAPTYEGLQVPGGPTGANRAAVDKFLKQQELLKKEPLDAWDVIRGAEHKANPLKDMTIPERRASEFVTKTRNIPDPADPLKQLTVSRDLPWEFGDPLMKETAAEMPTVDFYRKTGEGGKNLLGQDLKEGKSYTDWTPTIVSQTAGLYGGRMTDEEKWEATKARRRKELAFMYGIPEDMLGGEMQNPYYGGGGFWKDGGIATLEMDAGGAVNGPGGPKDDVIDAKLSDGEFVMTAQAVENLGGGDRLAGAKRMYQMMNQLDPQSETIQQSVMGV